MIKDQMFSQMNQAALARLAGREPGALARNAGIRYETLNDVCINCMAALKLAPSSAVLCRILS